ncbi:MAG TPA: outer membrane protein assembly factor BamA, partial [Stellaceae bacterium]|nr:outer membrane protein assembly factor BamA [Stellaceae bacterium]
AQGTPASAPGQPPPLAQNGAPPAKPGAAAAKPAALTAKPGAPAAKPGTATPRAAEGVVTDIRVEGTQRIEPETVRSYLLIQPGDPWDAQKVDDSLKSLFATGLFADVKLSRVGNTLVVKVVENPIINRIAFEGNSKLADKDLNGEIQLRPRVVYTRTRVQNDVKRILDLYRRHGRFGATVEPKVIQLSENRVDLVFEIHEGPFTGVRSINFVGNHEFSEGKLRGVIDTKESRWYRFLSTSDTYDPDRLTYDRELLRKFYLTEGYADFRVVSAVAELTPAADGFIVTFTLDEGQRYRFGKINVNIKLKDLPAASVLPLLTVHSGDWYNAEEVEKSITVLTNTLGNRGYAFVEVKPEITRNRKDHTLDITFDVQEGPRVYVERIDIVGNVRTLDKVIRREFQLVEGDAFNSTKMERSKERIKNLGFFKKVEVTNAPGSAPDKTVVTVEVEEQSTGELSLGLGFSTSDGPLADINIRERNFLGRGQDLRIGTVVSFRSQQVDLSFTEPYFLDRNIAAGFDLFEIKTSPTASFFSGVIPPFQQFSYGGALRTGYQITDNLRQTLKYTARSDNITDIQSDASLFIALQAGQHVTSEIGQVLLYDRRDNRLEPTEGYYASVGNDFAGVGFGVDYIRTKVNFGYYYSVAPDWVLSLTGEAGTVFGWNGQQVLLQDRFFVGGDNLRGFQTAGIGPRDSVTDDALGGQNYYVGSVTLGVPLGLPKELGLSGRVFTDFGSLWKIEPTNIVLTPEQLITTGGQQPVVLDSTAIRVSAGVGVSWKSPVGPIRLDVALPIKKQSFDQTQFFRISFGTRF